MQYAPTRVHAKFNGFHISASGYAKNAPDFTLPNKDTPKTHPILAPNLRRGTFRGVCNTPLHGYVQNLVGFGLKPSSRGISGRMLLRPTWVHEKPARFHIPAHGCTENPSGFRPKPSAQDRFGAYAICPHTDTPKTHPILDPNLRRRTFRGVCFCALHGYVKNLAGFIFPHTDTPKTHPILDPNHRRRTFRGVCFCALHEYVKNLAGFRPKPSARDIWGRMQYAPTRVHEKFGGFHISPHGYAKNAPGFTFSNKDTPKTCLVLGLNLWRGTFQGVCFCALHGCIKNLAGFIFPHTDTPKTHPILGLNRRREIFRGVCNTPLHGYMQNLAGFIFPHTT